MNRSYCRAAILILTSWVLISILTNPMAARPADTDKQKVTTPKNIIIMIGDGMGYNHVEATSCYLTGTKLGLKWQRFSFLLATTTFALGGSYNPDEAWSDPDYIKKNPTDSAAAATALSCGKKTLSGAIGVDQEGQPLQHLMERAEDLGKASGVVTTVMFSHATPAGFVAHNVSRNNYSQIAKEMIFNSAIDVIMGAGHPYYDDNARNHDNPIDFKYVGDETTWSKLISGKAWGADADGDGKKDKWTLITKKKEFKRLQQGKTPKRIIGIARVHQTLQQRRNAAPGKSPAEETPAESPLNKRVPTLVMMTKAALNVLDDDPDGFVLMVEGGAIDWASHSNQTGRMIEETLDFNYAVEAVVEWIEKNSNWSETLLIVTADHETGFLTGPGLVPNPTNKVKNRGAGTVPAVSWHSTSHTNALVPVYAEGAAAKGLLAYARNNDPVRGLYFDNRHIAVYIFKLLR